MERYLVTGGAGFIGSHIVETLVEQGHFVRVLDNFDTGSRENLPAHSIEVINGSIEDATVVQKAMEGIHYVFHQAARGSVPRSVEDPDGTHSVNVTGTLRVLEAARRAGVKRVICASSSSVYGEAQELPKRETQYPNPCSPYAAGKLCLEFYCHVYTRVYGLETVSLRYFNIFGPRQNPKLQYAAVIPIFISNMLAGKPCIIYGDGHQTRDFTYVKDCVKANLLACKQPHVAGKVFNIACGRQTSVLQLFHLLKEILNYKLDPIFQPPRAGDVRYSYGAIEKAQTELGFHPEYSLEEGLKKTVDWYKKARV